MFPALATITFYLFATVLLISAALVVSLRNAVHSVLFLILAFFNAAGLFLLAGAEFLAMILVIVYVGAVAVLFLFVVMMLDVNFVQMREGLQRYAPVGATLGVVLFAELIFALGGYHVATAAADLHAVPIPTNVTNTAALGALIYTHYLLLFQLSGLILLVAMIGAIVLTLRDKTESRRQVIANQIGRRVADTRHIVTMPLGEGTAATGFFRPLGVSPPIPAPLITHDHAEGQEFSMTASHLPAAILPGIGLAQYLTVGAILLVLGMFGIFLNRKNVIVIMMSIELILLAVNINLVAFSAALGDLAGQVLAMFVLTVAAAEAAIGLAIVVIYFRNRGSIEVEDVKLMKGLSAMPATFLFATAIFAPLLGAAITGLLGRVIGDRAAQIVTITLMVIAAASGVTAWAELVTGATQPGAAHLGDWVIAGNFHVDWALRYDTLSASMVAMVTFIATLIHIYSVGYMSHEETPVARFFSYLSLFSFAMLMLVSANNLLQLFFGWEGVGLASYLLIGYWYQKPSACAAAMKAFIVNRIADLFFAVGIAMVFATFGSIDFATIFAHLPDHAADTYTLFGTHPIYEVIGVLLFIGAMGKSAQIGLHVWLPDAMEGPTPVSALIHAATMVTAGVFLMARMSPVMSMAPHALQFVTIIGGTTALFAATIGCVQTDIKRVIAYSTCSQLGYMFVAAGVGAYQVSVFHLITHAFFKALLFLSAGSVIHAVHGEQDMRKMGGLWRAIPITYAVMWIGSLALAGIPPFAGYFSKDAILEAAYAAHSPAATYGFICGILAAFLTAFYSWRLLLLTFHGKRHEPAHAHDDHAHDGHASHDHTIHESPPVMVVPLLILALGAVIAGFLLKPWFIGAHQQTYWNGAIVNGASNHVLDAMEHIPAWVGLLPLVVGLAGIALAYLMYALRLALPAKLGTSFAPIYRLLLNKWYVDELYGFLFIRPYQFLARQLWQIGDAKLIDGIPNGLASLTSGSSTQIVRLQTGSMAVYAFTMLIGLVVLISTFLMFR